MKCNSILLLSIVVYCVACVTPTEMQQSWSNPEQKTDSTKRFQKILFVALLKDEYTRKIAEDKMVEQVRPRGVASYNYLPNNSANTDTSLISNRLKQDGFDGVVIMRLITIDKNTTNSSGSFPSYYNTWNSYYSTTFPLYNGSGNYSGNDIRNIEVNVYSLKENKLVWTGVTTAVNVSNKNQMFDNVIASVKHKMKSEGFIK